MPKTTDIPNVVYDNLRAITEYRFRRTLEPQDNLEFAMPHITNAAIFAMMPDHKDIVWEEIAQPALTGVTLHRMFEQVKLDFEAQCTEEAIMPQGGEN